MSNTTSIEWTRSADGGVGATWNPVTGRCIVVSSSRKLGSPEAQHLGSSAMQKGGAGKSTTCVNPAAALADHGRTLSDVVQEALAQLLRDTALDQADLERLDRGPIQAGVAPAHPVRRTGTILAEQDAILRTYRLLCHVQASDVVRQAIDHAFRPH